MNIELIRITTTIVVLGITMIAYWFVRVRRPIHTFLTVLTALFSAGSILFMVYLWFNHITFPLDLEVMENTVLQHVARLASGQYVYVAPTSSFIPLAYNPLYYVISLPVVNIFGLNLASLRLTAILGMFGIAAMIYLIIRQQTRSIWWAAIGVGLFAAAYRVMDTYLDNAHSDGWFIFAALLGSYVISRSRSFRSNALGIVILVLSFWFKQHGVLFVAGGLAFLLWRDGLTLPTVGYGIVAAVFGGAGYLFLGPVAFGPYFHYFTWQVPRQWSQINIAAAYRYLSFIITTYPLLSFFSILDTVWTAFSKSRRLTIWHFQLAVAMLSGIMGSLDPGSNNNVYIPMGVWFILIGTIGLYDFVRNVPVAQRHHLQTVVFAITFALFLYDPSSVIVSPNAQASYQDFIGMLRGLNGQVYAPQIGQLQADYTFVPGAHWVPLEDMIRGPGRDEENAPLTREILAQVVEPTSPAFLILSYPLENDLMLRFLEQYYVLDTDFGERFKALSTLPKRFGNGWPRYLYRYNPSAAR